MVLGALSFDVRVCRRGDVNDIFRFLYDFVRKSELPLVTSSQHDISARSPSQTESSPAPLSPVSSMMVISSTQQSGSCCWVPLRSLVCGSMGKLHVSSWCAGVFVGALLCNPLGRRNTVCGKITTSNPSIPNLNSEYLTLGP